MDEFPMTEEEEKLNENIDTNTEGFYTPKATPKNARMKGVSYNIVIDHEALNAGFDAPFSITFEIVDDFSKQDLIQCAVDAIHSIKEKYPKDQEIEKKFRRWFSKNFDLADRLFDDPETFKTELRKIDGGIKSLINTKPEVKRMNSFKRKDDTSTSSEIPGSTSLLHANVPTYVQESIDKAREARKIRANGQDDKKIGDLAVGEEDQ